MSLYSIRNYLFEFTKKNSKVDISVQKNADPWEIGIPALVEKAMYFGVPYLHVIGYPEEISDRRTVAVFDTGYCAVPDHRGFHGIFILKARLKIRPKISSHP